MKTQDLLSTILAFCAVTTVSASPVEKRLPTTPQSKHLRFDKRDEPGYAQGQPIDGKGKGAPLLGKSLSILNTTHTSTNR
jgi:oxalate decarboxylase